MALTGNHSIARYLARIADQFQLYGNNILQATEVYTQYDLTDRYMTLFVLASKHTADIMQISKY